MLQTLYLTHEQLRIVESLIYDKLDIDLELSTLQITDKIFERIISGLLYIHDSYDDVPEKFNILFDTLIKQDNNNVIKEYMPCGMHQPII